MRPEPVADWIEGKYEILGKIREGGMGAVYKVRHRLLHEIRVIKIIRPQLEAGPELNERFLREARLAIQLRHPNIAQLHDFSLDDDGRAFIVMEYIEGVTLEDVLKTAGPPPVGLALEIARQTLKGLGSMHRKGMVHRDVSPDNVMLSRNEDGEPRIALIDLGIAKALAGGSHLTTTGAFLGKPKYAAPEQFGVAGQDAVDTRSDLYSFGVVFYELLTGASPIQGRDPSSLIAGHLFRPPVDFAESDPGRRVPADLRAVVLRMLAKEPAERFQTAEQVDRELAEIGRRYPDRSESLEALLQAAATAPGVQGAPPPGTTQERLDYEFTASVTPAAPSEGTLYLGEVPRPVTPLPAPVPVPAAAPPPKPAPADRPRAVVPAPSPRRPSRLPWIAAALAIVLAGGLWWLQHPADRQLPAAPEAPVAAPSPVPPPPAPVEAVPAPATLPPSVVPPRTPTPSPVVPKPAPQKPAPRSTASVNPSSLGKPSGSLQSAPSAQPQPVPQKPVQEPAVDRPTPRSRAVFITPTDSTIVMIPPSDQPEPESSPPPLPDRSPSPTVATDPSPALDEHAKLLSMPVPSFPAAAKGAGPTRVVVAVVVDEEGEVIGAKALFTQGSMLNDKQKTALQNAAVQVASSARFKPARRGGVPIKVRVDLRVAFNPQ